MRPCLLCLDLNPGGRHLHLNPSANFSSVLCHPPTPLFPCTRLGHPAPPSPPPCPLLPPPACTRSFLPSSHMEVRGDPSLPRFQASRSPVRLRGKRRAPRGAPPSRYRLIRLSVLRGSIACALTGNLKLGLPVKRHCGERGLFLVGRPVMSGWEPAERPRGAALW